MKVLAQILDIDYKTENNSVFLRLYCKTKENERLIAEIHDFKPYLYVIPEEKEGNLREKLETLEILHEGQNITTTEVQEVRKDNQKVYKVFTNMPKNVPPIKDEIKLWPEVKGKREFDISFSKRYLIDKELGPMEWIYIEGNEKQAASGEDLCLVADKIEKVNSKEKIPLNIFTFDLEVLENKIILASIYSKNYKKVFSTIDFPKKQNYVTTVENEKSLIENLIETLKSKKADIILGYNTDGFDFQIIKEKAEKYKIDLNLGINNGKIVFRGSGRRTAAKIPGRINIDLYRFAENILAPELKAETLSLDNVANELLGEKKDEIDWVEFEKDWKNPENLQKLSKYCLRDSELTHKLGEKLCPVIFSISRLISQTPFDVSRMTYGQIVEHFLIQKAQKKDLLVPNRPSREKIIKRRTFTYTGAFVLEPKKGVYKNLAMLDYRSLYPSIIVLHNISPDTANCSCCKNKENLNGNHFCKRKKGFIPEILAEILKERAALKNRLKKFKRGTQDYRDLNTQQIALKYVLNASYGYMGYPSARWYCRECAETTTFLGRKYIQETIEKARKDKLNVLYSDTDSLLLQSEDIKEKAVKFLNKINKTLPKFLELEIEDFYKSGIFTSTEKGIGAKKRYALMTETGELRIKGFERVRRDWCALAKEVQEDVIRLVLTDKSKEAAKIVQEKINALKRKEIPIEKLGIYTQLKKSPEKYEIMSPHVQAAKKAIERGININVGETIRYVITEGDGRISDRAEIIKFATNYDSDYYIENQVLPAAMRVLKVLDYAEDDFLTKGKQTSLGTFAG